jgi:predicted nucleotidyltransferase
MITKFFTILLALAAVSAFSTAQHVLAPAPALSHPPILNRRGSTKPVRNAANGETQKPAKLTSPIPTPTYGSGGVYAFSVAVGDVNGDSTPDVLVANLCADANCTSGSVGVLLANGDGTLQAAVPYGSGGQYAYSLAVGDVNGDSKLDVVVVNQCSNTCPNGSVGVLLGNGDGTFQAAVMYSGGGARSVTVGDVNGDNKLDVLVTNQCDGSNCDIGSVGVLLGNGDGTFQSAVFYGSGGYRAVSVALGDVNGDGKPDVLVANECPDNSDCTSGSVGVLLGNGDGTFQSAVPYGSVGHIAFWVAVGDVNGDSKLDVLVANQCTDTNNCNTGSVGVLLGNGDGTFQTAVTYLSGGSQTSMVSVGDLNGDNKLDVLLANVCGFNCTNSLGVLLGNGDGTFQGVATYDSGGQTATSVAVDDVNGDSKLDVLVTNECVDGLCNSGSVGVLLGNGDGTFGGISATTTTTLVSSPNPSVVGQTVTLTAVVAGQSGGTPTGTVTFKSGTITLGTGTLSGGTTSINVVIPKVGGKSVTAVYSGDANFTTSTGMVRQVVNRAASTTTLSSSLNPSGVGQPVTFTATVTPQFSGTPTGIVTFKDNGVVIGTGTLSAGSATFTTSLLAPGKHRIAASYAGDTNFKPSSGTMNQTVVYLF